MSDVLERMVDAAFKRVDNGYLFKPWICWRLVRSPTYLVSGAQKAAISARLRQNFAMMPRAKIAFIVAVIAVTVPLFLAGMEPYAALMIATVAAGTTFLIASCVYAQRTIDPLLEGLPVAEQRLSLADRLEQQAKAMPWKLSLLLGLACIFGAVLVGSQIDWWFAVAFFLLMAAFQFWVAFLGWKAAKQGVR
jgi:uncharacterized Tic20 family protein